MRTQLFGKLASDYMLVCDLSHNSTRFKRVYGCFLHFQVVEVPDRYIVCGADYTRVREALTQVILGETPDVLLELLQVREITLEYLVHV